MDSSNIEYRQPTRVGGHMQQFFVGRNKRGEPTAAMQSFGRRQVNGIERTHGMHQAVRAEYRSSPFQSATAHRGNNQDT